MKQKVNLLEILCHYGVGILKAPGCVLWTRLWFQFFMWWFVWIRATGVCGKLIKTSPSSEGVKTGVYSSMLSTIETAGGGAFNVATIVVWVSEECARISTLFRSDLSSSAGSFASRCFRSTDFLWCPCAGVQRNHLDQVRRYPHPGAFQIADLPGFLL